MDKVIVTQKHIAEGLQKLGLKKADIFFVHSSLSRFGYVEGGADAVIDALLLRSKAKRSLHPTHSFTFQKTRRFAKRFP